MTPEDLEKLDRLFEQALDLPMEERPRFVREECADPEMRDRLERLLAHAEEDTDFLDVPDSLSDRRLRSAARELGALDSDSTEARPADIPGFRWIERIGEGGMGEVWRCEQLEPIRRPVAIKLIKRGMDSKDVLARFDTERQALGLMTHPNIARVFGGGETPSGRPYFVMELVEGEHVTRYCDRNRLSLRDRLDLFARVCDGVQHAHQKGIIHRDLKPSNVLVTVEDGRAVPKIIDFGIARAVEPEATDETLLTRLGDLVGTPEYMSPEQAELGLDIDTRTDIYSLGVLLYELLVGVRPFSVSAVRRGLEDLRRQILETDPPRPSARLRQLAEDPESVATQRRTDTSRLQRRLRGDLDWIAMKALEKDRDRRYASPSELAADIRRHLQDQPVLAGPPSATYRLRKLLRRHRTAAAASLVVLISILAGAGFSTWQAIRATRAEERALKEARASAEVTDFLVGLFEISDPDSGRGRTITAQELLEEGSRSLESKLDESPAIRARILATIGEIQGKLGLYDDAEELLTDSLAIREELEGSGSSEVITLRRKLGDLAIQQGDREASSRYLESALATAREELGNVHPETARILDKLAHLAFSRAHPEESLVFFREALDIWETLGMSDDSEAVTTWTGLGATLNRMGEFEEAEAAQRRALDILKEVRGPEHPALVPLLSSLASTLGEVGRLEESEAMQRRALEIALRAYGENHTIVVMAMNNLASSLARRGDLEQARTFFEKALEIRTGIYGPDHPQVAKVYKNLGRLATMQGRYEEAEGYLLRSLAIDREALGEETEIVAWGCLSLATLYLDAGRLEEAGAYADRAFETWEKTLGRQNAETSRALGVKAKVALARERFDEAEELFRETLEIQEATLPPGHPWVAVTLDGLGDAAAGRDRHEEALELHRRALGMRRQIGGEEHPDTARSLARIAREQLALGRVEDAERTSREVLEIRLAGLGPDHPDVASARVALAETLDRLGRREEADALYREALEVRRATLDPEHPDRLRLQALLDARGRG